MKKLPQTISSEILCDSKWLSFRKIHYKDARGNIRAWESVERKNCNGAVLIIARLIPSDRILLIKQYRPPAETYVIEFPAGLIDVNEGVETSAHRELYEETGYTGKIIKILPPSFNSPGLTGETVSTVLMEIDENTPENKNPVQHLEESEDIELIPVEIKKLPDFLDSTIKSGSSLDSKVAAYIIASAYKN